MKGRTGKGRIKTNSHDQAYWDRLKTQFESCDYDHSGAYRTFNGGRTPEMAELAASINEVEGILQGTRYQDLRKRDYFKPDRPDRLLRAGLFFKTK
jgi:hypothetical protein